MTTTAHMADRPLLGVLLMLGFCILAPLGDSLAKILGGLVPLTLLLFMRFAIQAAILAPATLGALRRQAMSARMFWFIGLRSLLHILGIGLMFTSLRYLDLADAVAIAFVMPFLMLLLGHYVLKETVGPQRLAACAVGFLGTLMVIQPNFADVGAPALYPLGVAVVFALFMLVTRLMAKGVDPVALQAISGVQATLLLLPVLILSPAAEWGILAASDRATLLMLLGIGLLGTGAHLLMTWSLRFAPASTVAPMQYLEIPFATLAGFIIFGDLPDGLAAAGIIVTIGAGLYIILRERATGRRPAPEAP